MIEIWDCWAEDNDGGCGSQGGVGGGVERRFSRAAMRRLNSFCSCWSMVSSEVEVSRSWRRASSRDAMRALVGSG